MASWFAAFDGNIIVGIRKSYGKTGDLLFWGVLPDAFDVADTAAALEPLVRVG